MGGIGGAGVFIELRCIVGVNVEAKGESVNRLMD